MRIEELPNDLPAEGLTKVLVVDDAALPSNERGVVKWTDITDLVPADCEWSISAGTQRNVSTAFGPADPACPDGTDAVGIGVDLGGTAATSKLNVEVAASQLTTGLDVVVTGPNAFQAGATLNVTGNAGSVRGVQALTYGTSAVAHAGDFQSFDVSPYASGLNAAVHYGTTYAAGVDGTAFSSGTFNYGTSGQARGNGSVNAGVFGAQRIGTIPAPPNGNYGVFGAVQNQDTAIGTDWAGYFRGNVMVTGTGVIPGGAWSPSDENLKTNIEEVSDALAVIAQLNPRSYDYQVEAFPQIGLPAGLQYGFLAQELEQVIPGAVKDITFQAQLDSTGQEIHPAVSSKIVNTDMMIPFLVAAVKEQQATIEELRNMITTCCAAQNGMAPDTDDKSALPEDGPIQEQRLLIIPNPVADLTRLEYFVQKAGKVSLLVSTSDGKAMTTLREEMAQEGLHTYIWNTSNLAAGTYICTYMLDGAVVVKRAVKVK